VNCCMIDYQESSGAKIAIVSGVSLKGTNDVLDLIGEVFYNGCTRMVFPKDALPEEFFSLKTGLAGEILQKFSNYRMKLAITGGFGDVKSKSLKSFIYECNNGKQIFFKDTLQNAIDALTR
jgi:hypothetical protein